VSTYYRIQDIARDASELLDPASWVSAVWYDATVMCGDCPDASGVTWENGEEVPCPACGGRGAYNLSERPRRGVSACRSVGELAAYFEAHAGQLDEDSVVVELEGELADDDDFDGDAVLVFPARVVSVLPAAGFAEFAELLDEVA